MDIIKALEWRYAVKKYNPNKHLSEEQIQRVLRGLQLTATSMGMQLMRFFVVENKDIRDRIKDVAYSQSQVVDASHLLVLCRRIDVKESDIDAVVEQTQKIREIPADAPQLSGYATMMKSAIFMEKQKQEKWLENQVYLAMGNLLAICAAEQIDATPMEGFTPEKVDEILELNKQGYASVLLCAIGYRADDDKYSDLKKVRKDEEQLISFIK